MEFEFDPTKDEANRFKHGLRLKAKQSLDRMLEMASGTIGKGDLGRV